MAILHWHKINKHQKVFFIKFEKNLIICYN